MRHITQEGLDLIKRFERFSRTVYFCPAGYPTIGYGHLVKSGEDFSSGIDEIQAEDLLRQDAAIAEKAVLRLITVPLTDGQFDALVSFTYNLGSGALQRSTLRRKVNRQEHAEVPEQFMRWVWAGGRRAQRVGSATLSGSYAVSRFVHGLVFMIIIVYLPGQKMFRNCSLPYSEHLHQGL